MGIKRNITTTWSIVVAASVFLVALNLRPAITAVGPLLPQLSADENLSETAQGLLGSLPLIAFAAISPIVPWIARRFGIERTILLALTFLAFGIVTRSYFGHGGLWAGTMVLGSAIAVGNVLVPVIVRRDYARSISKATGIYSACITFAAAAASAIAVPASDHLGWKGSLALWAIPVVLVGLIWIARSRSLTPAIVPVAAQAPSTGSVWRQPTAWLITFFMGLQSTTFYVMITWLPTIEANAGVSDRQAGWHLFVYQIVGIASALTIPRLLRRDRSLVPATVTASAPTLVGVTGLLILPEWSLIWAIIAGLGSGASLVVALSLISLRGRSDRETAQLSGMAQSLGYLFAAIGPVLAGAIAAHTDNWNAPLIMLVVLASLQTTVALVVGRSRSQ